MQSVSTTAVRPAAQTQPPQEQTLALFGIAVTDTTLEGAAAWIVARAGHRLPAQVSFLNADCVNIMSRNDAYRDALAGSDRVFADGIGVSIAARLSGHRLQDNVNGTDLFPVLCRQAAEARIPVYFFGAREGRAALAGQRMRRANPDLVVAGSHHGYIAGPGEEDELIASINASGAEILFVALGAPRQELWIARNRHRLKPAVILGVGGLFDYYSGSVQRAPLVIRKARLEWVWRLAMEPRRLAYRYLIGNGEFLLRVLAVRLVPPRARQA